MALGLLVGLVACGRIDFDARTDAQPGDPSLLAWFPMDDDPSDGAFDASQYHRDAICDPRCPTSTTGIRGAGFAFDGTQALALPSNPALDLVTGTVAFWTRIDAVPMTYQMIVTRAYQTAQRNSFEVYDADNNTLLVDEDATGGVKPIITTPSRALGTWEHVAATWDATTLRLFLDGVEVGSTPFSTIYDTNVWRLGADFDDQAVDSFLPGALDDVRIYNRPLALSEITALAAP